MYKGSILTNRYAKDFFYTCDSHLSDPNFATATDEEYLEAQRQKQQVDLEIKRLRMRWDEKNRYAGWDKLMSYTKSWSSSSKKEAGDQDALVDPKEQERSDKQKLDELTSKGSSYETALARGPKWFELNAQIFEMRKNKKNSPKPSGKRTNDYTNIKDASMFPEVPKNSLS